MITWTCHVCGKERPDDKISVFSSTRYMDNIPMTQNVRYCNDDPGCIEGAKTVNFFNKGKEIQIEEKPPWWKRVLTR